MKCEISLRGALYLLENDLRGIVEEPETCVGEPHGG